MSKRLTVLTRFGLVVTSVIGIAIGTGLYPQIKAKTRAKNVWINGVALKEKAITVGGRSYIPSKAVCEVLGFQITADGENDVVISTGGQSIPGVDLRSIEGAWTEEQVRSWATRVQRWLDKTELLFSLIKPDQWEINLNERSPNEELTKARKERIKALAFRFDSVKLYITEGQRLARRLQMIPYSLIDTVLVTISIEALGDELRNLANLRDQGISGGPSQELEVSIMGQGADGSNLHTEVVSHHSALMRWYSQAGGYPRW